MSFNPPASEGGMMEHVRIITLFICVIIATAYIEHWLRKRL